MIATSSPMSGTSSPMSSTTTTTDNDSINNNNTSVNTSGTLNGCNSPATITTTTGSVNINPNQVLFNAATTINNHSDNVNNNSSNYNTFTANTIGITLDVNGGNSISSSNNNYHHHHHHGGNSVHLSNKITYVTKNGPLSTNNAPGHHITMPAIQSLPEILETIQKSDHFPTIRHRWNTNEEIAALLITIERHEHWLSQEVRIRPKSGSMLLYSRKRVRYRRDGYCWKKRKDGKTTREDHMKLKVQGIECIYGCYVHSAILPTFHRRCYWLLQNPDIVLVHYLNVPYNDDNKIITPSLNFFSDSKKEWTRNDLISELKPMFFNENDNELSDQLEKSTLDTIESIVQQLMIRQRVKLKALEESNCDGFVGRNTTAKLSVMPNGIIAASSLAQALSVKSVMATVDTHLTQHHQHHSHHDQQQHQMRALLSSQQLKNQPQLQLLSGLQSSQLQQSQFGAKKTPSVTNKRDVSTGCAMITTDALQSSQLADTLNDINGNSILAVNTSTSSSSTVLDAKILNSAQQAGTVQLVQLTSSNRVCQLNGQPATLDSQASPTSLIFNLSQIQSGSSFFILNSATTTTSPTGANSHQSTLPVATVHSGQLAEQNAQLSSAPVAFLAYGRTPPPPPPSSASNVSHTDANTNLGAKLLCTDVAKANLKLVSTGNPSSSSQLTTNSHLFALSGPETQSVITPFFNASVDIKHANTDSHNGAVITLADNEIEMDTSADLANGCFHLDDDESMLICSDPSTPERIINSNLNLATSSFLPDEHDLKLNSDFLLSVQSPGSGGIKGSRTKSLTNDLTLHSPNDESSLDMFDSLFPSESSLMNCLQMPAGNGHPSDLMSKSGFLQAGVVPSVTGHYSTSGENDSSGLRHDSSSTFNLSRDANHLHSNSCQHDLNLNLLSQSANPSRRHCSQSSSQNPSADHDMMHVSSHETFDTTNSMDFMDNEDIPTSDEILFNLETFDIFGDFDHLVDDLSAVSHTNQSNQVNDTEGESGAQQQQLHQHNRPTSAGQDNESKTNNANVDRSSGSVSAHHCHHRQRGQAVHTSLSGCTSCGSLYVSSTTSEDHATTAAAHTNSSDGSTNNPADAITGHNSCASLLSSGNSSTVPTMTAAQCNQDHYWVSSSGCTSTKRCSSMSSAPLSNYTDNGNTNHSTRPQCCTRNSNEANGVTVANCAEGNVLSLMAVSNRHNVESKVLSYKKCLVSTLPNDGSNGNNHCKAPHNGTTGGNQTNLISTTNNLNGNNDSNAVCDNTVDENGNLALVTKTERAGQQHQPQTTRPFSLLEQQLSANSLLIKANRTLNSAGTINSANGTVQCNLNHNHHNGVSEQSVVGQNAHVGSNQTLSAGDSVKRGSNRDFDYVASSRLSQSDTPTCGGNHSYKSATEIGSQTKVSTDNDHRNGAENRNATITDYSPEWCYPEGGIKVLVAGPWHDSNAHYSILFDDVPVPTQLVQNGLLRCFSPKHEPGFVTLKVSCDDSIVSNSVIFEYRAHSPQNSQANDDYFAVDESLFQNSLLKRCDELNCDKSSPTSHDPSSSSLVDNNGNVTQSKAKLFETSVSCFIDKLIQSTGSVRSTVENSKCVTASVVNVNVIDRDGATTDSTDKSLLHLCVALNLTRLVSRLLQWRTEWAGANVLPRLVNELDTMAIDHHGCTPLMWACALGHIQMALILVHHNRDALSVANIAGQLPLDIARQKGHLELIASIVPPHSLVPHEMLSIFHRKPNKSRPPQCHLNDKTSSLKATEDDNAMDDCDQQTISHAHSETDLTKQTGLVSTLNGMGTTVNGVKLSWSRKRVSSLDSFLSNGNTSSSRVLEIAENIIAAIPERIKTTTCLTGDGADQSLQPYARDVQTPNESETTNKMSYSPVDNLDLNTLDELIEYLEQNERDSEALSDLFDGSDEQSNRDETMDDGVVNGLVSYLQNDGHTSFGNFGFARDNLMSYRDTLGSPSNSSTSGSSTYQNIQSPSNSSLFSLQSPSPPPSKSQLCEYFKASKVSNMVARKLNSLTLSDYEQRELYEAAQVIQKAYRLYKVRKNQTKLNGKVTNVLSTQWDERERQAAITIQHCYRRYKQYLFYCKQMASGGGSNADELEYATKTRHHCGASVWNHTKPSEAKRFKKSMTIYEHDDDVDEGLYSSTATMNSENGDDDDGAIGDNSLGRLVHNKGTLPENVFCLEVDDGVEVDESSDDDQLLTRANQRETNAKQTCFYYAVKLNTNNKRSWIQ